MNIGYPEDIAMEIATIWDGNFSLGENPDWKGDIIKMAELVLYKEEIKFLKEFIRDYSNKQPHEQIKAPKECVDSWNLLGSVIHEMDLICPL